MSPLLLLPFFAVYVVIFLVRKRIGAFLSVGAAALKNMAQLEWGITPPLPASIYSLFAAFVVIAMVLYVTSSKAIYAEFTAPIRRLILQPKLKPLLMALLVVFPILTGWKTWTDLQPDTSAPAAFRVVHPAPPSTVSVHGDTIDTKDGVNPFRHLEEDDPDAFAEAVLEGRRVYYQNCYFCHGDELGGDGHLAKGLNPRPISFRDQTTIAMFTETFLFWRVSKGGPGLPAASTPWDSAMPAWESFLTNDEMWKVILYLYDRTEQVPRVLEATGAGH